MRQAALAKEAGIHIAAIAVGLGINDELKSMASEPWENNVFTPDNFGNLKTLNDALFGILSDVCPRKKYPYFGNKPAF